MQEFWERYRYCPACGHAYGEDSLERASCAYVCGRCSYTFYQNSKPSATAVIPMEGAPDRVLMVTRATLPAIGKLALPGGFLSYGETPEQAAQREIFEETSLAVTIDRLLCCTMVDYTWCGDAMSVVEIAFLMRPWPSPISAPSSDEVAAMEFHSIETILCTPLQLAFPTHRQVLACYAATLRGAGMAAQSTRSF